MQRRSFIAGLMGLVSLPFAGRKARGRVIGTAIAPNKIRPPAAIPMPGPRTRMVTAGEELKAGQRVYYSLSGKAYLARQTSAPDGIALSSAKAGWLVECMVSGSFTVPPVRVVNATYPDLTNEWRFTAPGGHG